MSQSQSNNEEEIPSSILNHPDYLSPDILSCGADDLVSSGFPGSVCSDNFSIVAGSALSKPKPSSSSKWLSCIKRQAIDKQVIREKS